MKKIVLLTVLSLLGSLAMSCDNDGMDSPYLYATDDGFTPVTPPPPPPPPDGGYTKP